MWLIFKFLEERSDKKKAKKIEGKISDKSTFETPLNGIKAKNRQEVLRDLGVDDVLKLDTILTGETLGFEVLTSDKKSIGTIPSKISGELELAMGQGLEPYITNYTVTEGQDGVFNCEVTLGLKMD